MNQKNKNVLRKFVQWYKQDPDEKQEEEEFDEYFSKAEKKNIILAMKSKEAREKKVSKSTL